MADSVEIAKAYVQIVPSMEGAQSAIASGLSGLDEEGKAAGSGLGGGIVSALQDKLGKFAAPAAVATALAALAKGAFDLGESFDSAYDSIRTGTGATGQAFEDLKASALAVTSNVPKSMQEVSDTLAELNTRTGATGETLEQLTTTFMHLDEVGYSMDIDKATGMLTAWGVSAEDMTASLDELFVVSQSTGIGMDALSSAMSTNAASMQELGFSFEETAAMAGQFDKAGLDASGMMGKLSKAMTTLAKAGENPADVFRETVDEMQGFIDAGERARAIDLASDLFGTKGAAQFVQALETGAMDLDSLVDSMQGSSGIIAENAESTRSWGESLEILKNKASVALEPFASGVFQGLSSLLDMAVSGAENFGSALEAMKDAALENENVQAILQGIGETATSLGEAGTAAFSAFAAVAATLAPILQPIADLVGGSLMSAFNAVASLLTGTVVGALDAVKGAANAVKDGLNKLQSVVSGLDLNLPRFALPHFNISGGSFPWGIGGEGSAPSFSVDWYAKGGITNGTSLIGIGEAGPEAILPLQGEHMRPFADAVAENINNHGNTYIINGLEWTNDQKMEDAMMTIFSKMQRLGAM